MSGFNPFSTNAINYVDIINKYYMFNGLRFNALNLKWSNNVTNEDNGILHVVHKYMIDIRDRFKHCNVLETDQMEQIIDAVCVQ